MDVILQFETDDLAADQFAIADAAVIPSADQAVFDGKVFDRKLEAPYCAIKVTGALFHTQGGLAIDARTRVLRQKGPAFLNLFAAGGAAVGVSGTQASGYLSGNGLLTATVFGRLAGQAAASL